MPVYFGILRISPMDMHNCNQAMNTVHALIAIPAIVVLIREDCRNNLKRSICCVHVQMYKNMNFWNTSKCISPR